MARRKRKSRKRFAAQERAYDAACWLRSHNYPKNLIEGYSKRFGVPEYIARDELGMLGFYDQICIQDLEADGIEWEYKVEPLSGDMFVVPKGTEEHELYSYHPII